MVRVDSFAIFFHLLIPAISAVCILASLEYLDAQNIRSGEYYALILFGTVGMVLDVIGGGAGADLYRPGNFLDLHLHSCRIPPPQRRQR